MLTLSPSCVRSWRAANQFLAGGARAGSVEEIVARVVAVQCQDLAAAAVGLWTRCRDLPPDAVARARDHDQVLRRGWFLRGTLHYVAAADAGWLLRLFGPAGATTSRARCAQLGVDDALLARAERRAADALAEEGPLTRAEVAARLAALGVPAQGQAPFHVLRYAAHRGLLRHGPVRDGEPTFVVATPEDDPPGPDGDAAVAELARRYLWGHGPATAADFATWSGLSATTARRAWSTLRDCTTVAFGDHTTVVPTAREDALAALPDDLDVRLLPAYDDYLLAYRSRELVVADEHARRVWPGGGVLRPCVLVDGRAVATWGRPLDVQVDPFAPLDPAVADRVREQAGALHRHLAG